MLVKMSVRISVKMSVKMSFKSRISNLLTGFFKRYSVYVRFVTFFLSNFDEWWWMMMMMETLKALVTSVKKRMWQKLKSLLWLSVAIVTSTSLSSADIFTSSSDLNYLLYSTSIEMLCLARQSQLALRVIKYIPLTLHSINTYEISINYLNNQRKWKCQEKNTKMQLVTLSLQGRLKVKIRNF